jgi:hypothetical protein
MALIKLSSNLEGISGSISQLTYSKLRNGYISKNKSFPGSVHPFTPSSLQRQYRTFFKNSILRWKTLTTQQVEDWNNLAKSITLKNIFNEDYKASGNTLFLQLMQNRQIIGENLYSNAPTKPTINGLSSFDLTATLSPTFAIRSLFTGITTDSNVRHVIHCTPSCNAGKSYLRNKYRICGFIPSSTTTQYFFTTAFNNLFPLPTLGNRIRCILVPIDILTGFSGISIIDWTTVET